VVRRGLRLSNAVTVAALMDKGFAPEFYGESRGGALIAFTSP
jgi:hypothetical protein